MHINKTKQNKNKHYLVSESLEQEARDLRTSTSQPKMEFVFILYAGI